MWKNEETRALVDQAVAIVIDKLRDTPTVLLKVLRNVIDRELQSR